MTPLGKIIIFGAQRPLIPRSTVWCPHPTHSILHAAFLNSWRRNAHDETSSFVKWREWERLQRIELPRAESKCIVAHLHGAALALLLIFTPFGSKKRPHRDERAALRLREKKSVSQFVNARAARKINFLWDRICNLYAGLETRGAPNEGDRCFSLDEQHWRRIFKRTPHSNSLRFHWQIIAINPGKEFWASAPQVQTVTSASNSIFYSAKLIHHKSSRHCWSRLKRNTYHFTLRASDSLIWKWHDVNIFHWDSLMQILLLTAKIFKQN